MAHLPFGFAAGALALAASMFALEALPAVAAESWRSFGYPAQHTDMVSSRSVDGKAAFNFRCGPFDADGMLEMEGNIRAKKATTSLIVDGKRIASEASYVSNYGSVVYINFAGGEETTQRWLKAIAGAGSDIVITVDKGHTAHFPLDKAKSAASTGLSYCTPRVGAESRPAR